MTDTSDRSLYERSERSPCERSTEHRVNGPTDHLLIPQNRKGTEKEQANEHGTDPFERPSRQCRLCDVPLDRGGLCENCHPGVRPRRP